MLHSLEHVGDHQNPLADTPTLVSCQAPQLGRPRFAAKKVYRHPPSPKTWYPSQLTLPHLEITGSWYNPLSTLLQRFACARLSRPCLPKSGPGVSATLPSRPGEFHPEHRVGGGSPPPPPPTERSMRISRTTLFGRWFTALWLLFARILFPWSAVHLFA